MPRVWLLSRYREHAWRKLEKLPSSFLILCKLLTRTWRLVPGSADLRWCACNLCIRRFDFALNQTRSAFCTVSCLRAPALLRPLLPGPVAAPTRLPLWLVLPVPVRGSLWHKHRHRPRLPRTFLARLLGVWVSGPEDLGNALGDSVRRGCAQRFASFRLPFPDLCSHCRLLSQHLAPAKQLAVFSKHSWLNLLSVWKSTDIHP